MAAQKLEQRKGQGLAVHPRGSRLARGPVWLALASLLVLCLPQAAAAQQLYRINNGGPAITAIDGGLDWAEDSNANPSPLRISGTNDTNGFSITTLDPSVPSSTPPAVFLTERWENSGGEEMSWAFPVTPGSYEVRLYFGNGFGDTSTPGTRVFDVSIEGVLVLDDYDIVVDVGHLVGVMKSFIVASDDSLDIDFAHVVQNPLINAIEILPVDPNGFLSASPQSADFGLVEIATTSTPQSLQLTNLGDPGDADIAITNVVASGEFTTTLTPQTLTPGSSTSFDVAFAPTAVGAVAETLTITHDGNNSPLVIALAGEGFDPAAVPISFSSTNLAGELSNNPTSLDFGPDGRLYVAQQNGTIYAYTIQRNDPTDYFVTATEQIDLVKNIVNHDDDGSVNLSETNRQVTGLLATGTAVRPVLYVTSSDPRIGAGGGGGDLDLDTNSGVISRLIFTGTEWEHVQIVRGLPRSEENHSNNGMALDEGTNTLYVMSGGHTNKGAPSNNFAQTPEYALAAAMLSVDLNAIEALPVLVDGQGQDYIYDIPTLDDPTVAGPDPNDPFGGNDGRNQARIVPGGPVQVYSPGYRNAYDVVMTEAGRLYTHDNGPNTGWGGIPIGEGTALCTNETNEGDSQGYGDGLHFVSGPGYYGGHPHPTRANPETSDLVIYENQSGNWVEIDRYDWQVDFAAAPPVPFGTGNTQECDYQIPGVEDGSLVVIGASTNGLDEYTASNFSGAMQGDLLAASFNGNIYRFELNAAGDAIVNGNGNGEVLLSGFGGQPLDVVALGDDELFPGTIFAAVFGADSIAVFEPLDFGSCSGADDPLLDEDNDGFDNADEIANGTNPCSAGSQPPDADGDSISDLLDPDDDNDGTPDVSDPFGIDPDNGTTTSLPVDLPLFNAIPGTGYFGLGFTGLMSNGTTDPITQFDEGSLAAGGAAGLFTVEEVSAGDAIQANNDQQNAFLLGVDVDTSSTPFVVNWRLNSPYFAVAGAPTTPIDFQSFGGFIGTGSQDDYLKVVVNAQGGAGGVQVLLEDTGLVTSNQSFATGVTGDILGSIFVDLFLTVDPQALTAQPAVSLDGGPIVPLGAPVSIPAAWLSAVDAQGLAVGVISTSFDSGTPFGATWDFINIAPTCSVDADCDDAEFCTVDSCVNGVCQNAAQPAGLACEADFDFCTFDACDGGGACVLDSTVSCNPGELCEPSTGLCEVVPGDPGDQDGDGLESNDPCVGDPRNLCFGPVAVDQTTLTEIRINASGGEACGGAKIDCNGDTWNADFGFNTASTADCNLNGGGEACVISGLTAIFGCEDDATEDLVQCERFDAPAAPELVYDFDLPNGGYLVNFLFAETFDGTLTPGARVFDVLIEDALVLDDFDQVVVAGGGASAIVRSILVDVVDGDGLQIEFIHVTQNPAVKAIEILVEAPCSIDADCEDFNECTTDVCNAGSCQNTAVADGLSCDDGLSCTNLDVCTAGVCGGTSTCLAGEFCSPITNACETSSGEALVAITPNGGLASTTFSGNAFQITNNSLDGQFITSVTLDFSTGVFPDIVFDPTDGTPAGDAGSSCLTPNAGAAETGYVVPADACLDPYSGPNESGYFAVTLDFTDFGPGEFFAFNADVDPTSIQNATGTGAAGAVAGIETIGGRVQVSFDDGMSFTADLFKQLSSPGGAQNIVKTGDPGTPTLEAVGVPSTPVTVSTASQTLRVTAPEGASVRLVQIEGGLELFQAPGFNVEPFEANEAVAVFEQSGVVPAGGFIDFPVTLTETPGADFSDDGLNHFLAVIEDPDLSGRTGPVSNLVLLRYDPNAACSVDADCDDGAFCNGVEFCSALGTCQAGTPPGADDGIACTDEVCDEVNDVVTSVPNDANCSDGAFCNGLETCDPVLDCQSIPEPCLFGETCDEAGDFCFVRCTGDADCDGIPNAADPCQSDPFNLCGVTATALCAGAGGNCGAPGEPIRFDTGPTGPVTTCDGRLWQAESGGGLGGNFGGNVTIDSAAVVTAFGCTDAASESLVSSERFGSTISRSYPVANGSYSVNLLMAEAFQPICNAGIGGSLLDISLEGDLVFDDFDPFATALAENGVGCGSLVIRSAVVEVTDGTLNLSITADPASGDDNAALKAIEVIEVQGCTVDADCDDGDACSADVCNAGVCRWTALAEGASCDDGDLCTQNDVCSDGVCGGVFDSDNDGLGDVVDPSCSPDPCPGDPLNACAGFVAVDALSGQDIRVNAGPACSLAFTDCRGASWNAEFGAQTNLDTQTCDLAGGCAVDATGVFGCTDATTEALFQCVHMDPDPALPALVYDFDVPDGDYLVNLLFMNASSLTTGEGARQLDILVEGNLEYIDFDPVAAAGGSGLPVVRSIAAAVADGNGLQIELLHGSADDPLVQGIEVLNTPEPGALLGLVAGGGLLLALARRRRQARP